MKEQKQPFADLIRATPTESKSCKRDDEVMSDIDLRILRSSNRPMSHGSVLPKGNDYLFETQKKRQSRSAETENAMVSTSLHDNKKRKSDPPRVARLVRTTKAVTSIQGPSIQKRIGKDQVAGIKDTKKKIWSR